MLEELLFADLQITHQTFKFTLSPCSQINSVEVILVPN